MGWLLKSFFERQVFEEGLGAEPPKNFVQPCFQIVLLRLGGPGQCPVEKSTFSIAVAEESFYDVIYDQ